MSDTLSGVVSVKIYDREYALRTTTDAERLRVLSATLDRRMRDLAASSGSADTLKVAVLAGLSLADELDRARQALHEMDDLVSRRARACVSMLDRFLC